MSKVNSLAIRGRSLSLDWSEPKCMDSLTAQELPSLFPGSFLVETWTPRKSTGRADGIQLSKVP